MHALPRSWSPHQGICSPRLITWSESSPAVSELFWIPGSGTELVLKNYSQDWGGRNLKTHQRVTAKRGWDQRPRPVPIRAAPPLPSHVPPSQCANQRSCRGWRWGRPRHSSPPPPIPGLQICQPHVFQLRFQCGLTLEASLPSSAGETWLDEQMWRPASAPPLPTWLYLIVLLRQIARPHPSGCLQLEFQRSVPRPALAWGSGVRKTWVSIMILTLAGNSGPQCPHL